MVVKARDDITLTRVDDGAAGSDGLPGGYGNMLIGSNVAVTNSDYAIKGYQTDTDIKPNTKYTVVMRGKFTNTASKAYIGMWFNDGSSWAGPIITTKDQTVTVRKVVTSPNSITKPRLITFYNYPSGSRESATIEWCAMYEGDVNVPLHWTPSSVELKGDDGQMLYATCATASATVAKVATLVAGTLTLKAGATVAVRFTNANNAASPTLNVGGTGAKAIYTQGVRYAYWAAGATVIFTYDGTYWRVASEPVYASTATIGNPAGYNVYIDGDSVAIRDGNKAMSTFSETGIDIKIGKNDDMVARFSGFDWSIAPRGFVSGRPTYTVCSVDPNNGDISFKGRAFVGLNKILAFKDYQIGLSEASVLIESGARSDLKVEFGYAFETVPDVILAVPYTSTGGGVEIAVKDFSRSGFTANMKNGGASAAYFKVCYLAVCF